MIALTRCTFVIKLMSLPFNMLFRLVIAFLPSLLTSWLLSPSALILEPDKIKFVTVSMVSSSICHEVMGPDAMISAFWMLSFKPTFSISSFTFIKRLFSSTSALLTMSKPFTMWIATNRGKFFKRWDYQTTLPSSWEICMQIKKQQLELDMEQQTGSKSGKQYVKAVYCHPTYLTYMQSTSREMPDWMKYKLESRLQGEISITSDMQMIPLLWQITKRN